MSRVFSITNLLVITILSIFLSKSLFNITILLLFFVSVVKAIKKPVLNNREMFYHYSILAIIGFVFNFYNQGLKGIGNFLSNERNLLYVFIFIILNLNIKQYEKIKDYILVGGIIGALYSTISFFTPKFLGMNTLYNEYYKTNKMQSFQPGIRWGRLLQILVPFSYINLEWFKKRIYKISCIFLSVFFIWNIVINGQRAGILSVSVSMIIFFLMYIFSLKKNKVLTIILTFSLSFFIVLTMATNNKMIKERVKSIFDFNENISNIVRIGYWKIGMDMLKDSNYLGVGSGRVGDGRMKGSKFEVFISQQSKEYREKYYKYNEGKPFENNYLNLAVENGLLYLVYLVFVQIFIFRKLFMAYISEDERDKKIKLMIIFSLLIGDRVFIFFYPDTDAYVEFIGIFLMFYGFKLSEKKGIE